MKQPVRAAFFVPSLCRMRRIGGFYNNKRKPAEAGGRYCMKRRKWKSVIAGIMAFMTICTSAASPGLVHAAEGDAEINQHFAYEAVQEYLDKDEMADAGDWETETEEVFQEQKSDAADKLNSSNADNHPSDYDEEPANGDKENAADQQEFTVSGGDAGSADMEKEAGETDTKQQEESTEEDISADWKSEEIELAGNAAIVYAANPESRSGGTVNLEVGKEIGYPGNLGNYSTHYYYVNGKIAYCLESMKGSPASGQYAAEILEGNGNLQKALYYGYGGVCDLTDSFMPQFDDDLKYVFTHLAVSYFYCGTDAFRGCSMEDIISCGVWGYIEFLASQPDPVDPYLSLSQNSLTASYDGNRQITDQITLNGDSRNYITLNIPENVTYHNSISGETKTGGAVNVYGGTSFYFTAPLTVTSDWNTGEMYGSTTTVWKALVVKTENNVQDIGSYYEEYGGSAVSFCVDWLEIAKISVTKVDSKSEVGLAGAVFGIYKDKAYTELIAKLPPTNEKGYTEAEVVKTQDTVYIKEITAPKGYRINTKVYKAELAANQTIGITVPDTEQMAELTVYKEGESLTGAKMTDEGIVFQYEKKRLPGAVFSVYAGKDIYTGYGELVYKKGDLVKANLTTNEEGTVVIKNLHLGTYIVKEVQAPEDYILNGEQQTIKLSYGGQEEKVIFGSVTFTNERQKAGVSAVKKDEDTLKPLTGGIFGLYADSDITDKSGKILVNKGTLIEKAVTGEDGKASFHTDIPIGFSYSVKEIQAPYSYYRNTEDVYSFQFKHTDQGKGMSIFTHTFKNPRVTAKIHLYKVDKEIGISAETGKAASQGDASLTGAVYGVYAREDIIHPDGATGVIFKAGDLVGTVATDENAEAEIKGLYLGTYYLKEIKAPEGYLLDEKEHDVVCSYEGDLTAEVARSIKSEEQVYKQPFQLIKVSDNGDDTEAPALSGAGFTAYLKSSLSVNEDGSYDFDSAEPVVIGTNGETTLLTDSKGHLVTQPIPYGTYVVIETIIPNNMKAVKPFEVRITENHPTEPQVWRVFIDREFTAKLRIVKKDSRTGQTVLVPNAEFKIFNMDTREYVTQYTTYPTKVKHTSFFTDEDGDLILPEALKLGNYRIEEVAAPEGYMLNQEYITFSVDTDTAYVTDPDTFDAIITADYVDEPAVGELTVEKKGEVLDSYKGGLFADSEEKEFVYREGSLAGAEFAVYAAEDIYTNDYQKDENGERTKYYSEGTLVATLVTDENGKAVLSNLPLGTYKVVETKAPYGYALNKKEQTVTFVYVDDRTPVIQESLTFENDRQKVDVSVLKLDGETELPIAGAEFGLYAAADIENADGKVIIEKDTLLEVAVSGTDGKAKFVKDYPLGSYYAKEIKAPEGYVSSEEIVDYDASYQGQDVPVVRLEAEFINTPTTVEITKTDITSGEELSGATLSVVDVEGNVVDEWTTVSGEPHVIKRLHVGEVYTLREKSAPYGYLQAEEILFTVSDAEASEGSLEVQSVEMQDEVPTGTIIINKDGEFLSDINLLRGHWYDFIFDYFKKSLAGVAFEVYAAEDIVSPDGLNTVYYEKDTLVAEIVTNDKGIASIENLPLGKYYLVETKTLEGFVLEQEPIEADLSYVDQYTKVVYAGMAVTNERQKVQVTIVKTDAETGNELEGAVFGLYAAEDIVNADGKAVVAKDTLVEKAVTGKDGKCVFTSDLPLGQYYVKEIKAPEGYVLGEDIFELDASYQGDDVKAIEFEAEFENYPTKLEISKTDITGEHELKDATLSISDKDGKVVEAWKSDGKPHMIDRIPVGEYILHEEAAPYGYKIANEVNFTVENTKEIQQVSMKDELVDGRIIIEKTDADTGSGIAGVEFEIRDKDGNIIETLVTDKNGYAESKELPIAIFKDGNFVENIVYYAAETKAAEGYILDSTPHEVVLQYDGDAPDIVEYILKLTNKPTEPKLPQTGDNMSLWLYVGIGLAVIVVGGLAAKKEENK